MNGDKQSIDGIIAFLNKGPLNDETGKMQFIFTGPCVIDINHLPYLVKAGRTFDFVWFVQST